MNFFHLLINLEKSKGSIGVRVESNKDFKLFFGRGFVLGDHEFGQLIDGAKMVRAVEAIDEGIVGSESVVEAFLFGGLVEELRGEIWVELGLEDLSDEV